MAEVGNVCSPDCCMKDRQPEKERKNKCFSY